MRCVRGHTSVDGSRAWRRRAVRAVAATASVLGANPVFALEWSYAPSLRLGAGQNTNQRMTVDDQRRVGSGTMSAGANLLGRSDRLSLSFAPRVSALRYDDEREADRDDVYADFALTTEQEHGTWTIGAGRASDGTLSSELESTEFFGVDVDREQSSVSTSWIRRTERGAIDFGASGIAVEYGDAQVFTPFRDYRNGVLRAGYTLLTNERSSWRFGVTRLFVENDFDRESSSTDVRVTWSRSLSTSFRAHVGIGAYRTTADGVAATTDPALDFGVGRSWPRWDFTVGAGRQLKAEGGGDVQREDNVSLRATRRVTERFTLGAGWSAIRAAVLGGYEYDYSQASFTAEWRLERRWLLDGTIAERRQQWSLQPAVSGLVGQLAVTYRGLQ